jgi:hypothetical protein
MDPRTLRADSITIMNNRGRFDFLAAPAVLMVRKGGNGIKLATPIGSRDPIRGIFFICYSLNL